MTDELIKRLRSFGEQGFPIAYQSADALEALAKRIAELEEERGALIRDRTENLCALADAEADLADALCWSRLCSTRGTGKKETK